MRNLKQKKHSEFWICQICAHYFVSTVGTKGHFLTKFEVAGREL